VNVIDGLRFLRDGKRFLWPSERDGYRHLYLYRMDGRASTGSRTATGRSALRRRVALGRREGGVVYFTALEKSSIERHLYSARLDGTG